MLSEHKRVKHGSLPGSIPKRDKILIREGKEHRLKGYDSIRGIKVYLKSLVDKGRTVQRRRDKEEIERSLEEN